MKIDAAGAGLSPWRQRVLPLLLRFARAAVAYIMLRWPLDLLLRDPIFLAGYAPHVLQYVLAACMAIGMLLFVASRTVVYGALLIGASLLVFEFLWRAVGQQPHYTTLIASLAVIGFLSLAEWYTRRLQRRIYGSGPR